MTPTAIYFRRNARQSGQSKWILIATVGGLALLALVIFFPGAEPERVPAPSDPRASQTVAPAETAEQRGDTARSIIAAMKAGNADIDDYAQAVARAEQFQQDGQLADAQLLYFFAARGGNADAAFTLATMYDPLHYADQQGLMNEPDLHQAYQWYSQAQSAGFEEAGERLAALRVWTERAAQAGNAEAERLLLQWE